MLNKIYLGVLAIAVVMSGIVTYLAYSWLKSPTDPADVVRSYEKYASYDWYFLWISTLILLLIGNAILWQTRKVWALWATFGYFTVFMILQTFWLEPAFFDYRQNSNLTSDTVSFSPIFGVFLIVLVAIIVFLNQFLVKRLHDKMYLPAGAGTLSEDKIISDEKES